MSSRSRTRPPSSPPTAPAPARSHRGSSTRPAAWWRDDAGHRADARSRVRRAGRAPPARAARPLLPHAGIVRGGGGSRSGDAAARVAEPGGARARRVVPRVALPDQRLPRRDQALRPARAVARLVPRRSLAAAVSRPAPGRGRAGRGPARRGGRRPRDDRAHVPRRDPAAPARRADPTRRAGLARERGRRAARARRRRGQQRAAARAGDAAGAPARGPARGLDRARGERVRARAARRVHRQPRARRHGRRARADRGRRARDDAAEPVPLRGPRRRARAHAAGVRRPGLGDWRLVPTRANRQPAAASYLRAPGETEYRAFKLDVLRVADGRIAEVTTFDATLFEAFGLPLTL